MKSIQTIIEAYIRENEADGFIQVKDLKSISQFIGIPLKGLKYAMKTNNMKSQYLNRLFMLLKIEPNEFFGYQGNATKMEEQQEKILKELEKLNTKVETLKSNQ